MLTLLYPFDLSFKHLDKPRRENRFQRFKTIRKTNSFVAHSCDFGFMQAEKLRLIPAQQFLSSTRCCAKHAVDVCHEAPSTKAKSVYSKLEIIWFV